MAKPKTEKDYSDLSKIVKKSAKNEADFLKLFSELLTESEIQMIKNRIKIGLRLTDGYSVRQIAKEIGVGTDTVVRVSKILKNSSFQKVLPFFEYQKKAKETKKITKSVTKKPSSVWVFGKSEEEN